MRDPSARRSARLARWLCAVAAMLLASGCGGGDDGGGGGIEDEFLDFGMFEEPYETVEQCIAFSEERGVLYDATACACENCFATMQECDVLDGCIAIRSCGFSTGCRGAFECYLLPGAPCVEVINDYGNASVAAAITLDLSECQTASACER